MEVLALGAAKGEYFRRVLRYVPRANEQVKFAEVTLSAVRKANFIVHQAVADRQIAGDPADTNAVVLANVDACLRAKVGALKVLQRVCLKVGLDCGMEDRH
ncbi:hypothetical protein D3C86_1473350 [compost metagenome]